MGAEGRAEWHGQPRRRGANANLTLVEEWRS